MAEIHFLAVQEHRSGIRLVNPGKHLHQRGLPGAVFAHEPVYLAPVKAKLGVFQYGNAEETLGQPTDFQNRLWRRGILMKPPETDAAPVPLWFSIDSPTTNCYSADSVPSRDKRLLTTRAYSSWFCGCFGAARRGHKPYSASSLRYVLMLSTTS